MNFIIKLFKSKDPINNTTYNNIFVIIEYLIKYSKFIPINKSYSIKDLTDTVVRKIINNYRSLDKFITDRSTTFIL